MTLTTRPLIDHCLGIATGAGAVGVEVNGEANISYSVFETDVADLHLLADARAYVQACGFVTFDLDSGAVIVPLPGDRAVWDALHYASRHANDIDNVLGIHHTIGDGDGQVAPGDHTHDHATLSNVTSDQHHARAHTLGSASDHSDAPANIVDGFLKRNAANDEWEEVAYGTEANTVSEGNHAHGMVGQYRQFVYEVSDGDFHFVIDGDGQPVMALQNLE